MIWKINNGWNNINDNFWKDPWNIKFTFDWLNFPEMEFIDNFYYRKDLNYSIDNFSWLIWNLNENEAYRFNINSKIWFDILKIRKDWNLTYWLQIFNFKSWQYIAYYINEWNHQTAYNKISVIINEYKAQIDKIKKLESFFKETINNLNNIDSFNITKLKNINTSIDEIVSNNDESIISEVNNIFYNDKDIDFLKLLDDKNYKLINKYYNLLICKNIVLLQNDIIPFLNKVLEKVTSNDNNIINAYNYEIIIYCLDKIININDENLRNILNWLDSRNNKDDKRNIAKVYELYCTIALTHKNITELNKTEYLSKVFDLKFEWDNLNNVDDDLNFDFDSINENKLPDIKKIFLEIDKKVFFQIFTQYWFGNQDRIDIFMWKHKATYISFIDCKLSNNLQTFEWLLHLYLQKMNSYKMYYIENYINKINKENISEEEKNKKRLNLTINLWKYKLLLLTRFIDNNKKLNQWEKIDNKYLDRLEVNYC